MKNHNLFLLVLFTLPACGPKGSGTWDLNAAANKVAQDYLEVLATIDPCLGKDESFNDMALRMKAARAPLDKIDNIDQLKAIYYACNKKYQEEPPRKERCGSAYHVGQERAIERVGEIGNTQAAAFLMELYKDETRKFIGGSRAVLGKAMVGCGEHILPQIEAIKDLRIDLGPRVVDCIKNGTSFY